MATNTLENVLNFRDVGKTINAFTGQKLMVEGMVYRSARLDDASPADLAALGDFNRYGLRTIMDLRTKSEHVKQAKKREADKKLAALKPDSDFIDDNKIPRVEYLPININGKGFERNLLWQLTWWQLIKLITLMALGYRMSAISILGTNVMLPRGLIGLGYDTLDYCQTELCTALTVFSRPLFLGTLVHCTQGKDRTGMVIALVLFLLEIPIEAISYDYMLSEKELTPVREKMLGEIREIGLSEEFAGCPEGWVKKMREHIDEKYEGINAYLERIGVDMETQKRIVALLRGGGMGKEEIE